MVRVVAVDVDGTLLRDDGTVSTRNIQTIRDCQRRGITILLVTARAPGDTVPVAIATGTTDTAICCLGAVVYHVADAAVHYSTPLPRAAAESLIAGVREVAPTAAFGWVTDTGTGREAAYPLHRPTPDLQIGPIDQHLDGEIWHLFIRDTRRQPLPTNRIRATVRHLAEVTDYDHDLQLIDFTATGVNKGSALQHWCTSRHITSDQVAAIGDSNADLPMLAWAATSAAVANASSNVRTRTNRTVPDNNSDGVAVFLEQLLPHV